MKNRIHPHSRGPAALVLALACLALPGGAADAADSVIIQVEGNDKLSGTLRPADETEVFLCDLPRGTAIKAVAKGKGKGAPVPGLVLNDSSEVLVAAGQLKGKKVLLPKTTAAVTDRYRLRLSGDGVNDGDYKLTIKFKPQKKFSGTGEGLAPGAEAMLSFAAPAGSVAKIKCKAANKTGFVPALLDVTGPEAFVADVSGASPNATKPGRATAALGGTGEYVLRFRNDGAAAGDFSVSVKLKLPKLIKRITDITDDALAQGPVGGQQVAGQVIGASGGAIDMPIIGGPLDGSRISLPGGALGLPTLLTMTPGNPFSPAPGVNPAGPAVTFGPSGTQFAEDATLTIPFDPGSVDDPETELVVWVQDDETGEAEIVPQPYDIDAQQGLMSFPASHFSTYMATTTNARPLNGSFFQLEIGGDPQPGFGGLISVGLHEITAEPTQQTGNPFLRQLTRHDMEYVFQAPPIISITTTSRTQMGSVDIQSDGVVVLDIPQDEVQETHLRGPSPNALLGEAHFAPVLQTSLLLRRAPGPPTPNALAGKWRALVWEFSAEQAPDNQVRLSGVVREFNLRFKADGSVTAPGTSAGTFAIGPDAFDVGLTMDLKNSLIPVTELVYCDGGNAMIGVSFGGIGALEDSQEAHLRAAVLIRASSGANNRLIEGEHEFVSFSLRDERTGNALEWVCDATRVTHDGNRRFEFDGSREVRGHVQGTGQLTGSVLGINGSGTYSVAGDGRYVEGNRDDAVGAVFRTGSFYVAGTTNDNDRTQIGFGLLRPRGEGEVDVEGPQKR